MSDSSSAFSRFPPSRPVSSGIPTGSPLLTGSAKPELKREGGIEQRGGGGEDKKMSAGGAEGRLQVQTRAFIMHAVLAKPIGAQSNIHQSPCGLRPRTDPPGKL